MNAFREAHRHLLPAAEPLGSLDLIYGLVNALGGYTDPRDPAAVAWAKEHAAVLAYIEECGGRDPGAVDPDWALKLAAQCRGQTIAADLYDGRAA